MKIELETADIERLASEITLRVTQSLKSGLVSPMPDADTVYDVAGLAKYLQTTPKWVYSHLDVLPHLKIDGLLRFKKKIIDNFFEKNFLKLPKSRYVDG